MGTDSKGGRGSPPHVQIGVGNPWRCRDADPRPQAARHAVLFTRHVRTHITTNDIKLSCGIAKISKETQEWLGGRKTKRLQEPFSIQFYLISCGGENEGGSEGRKEGGRAAR